MSSRGVILSRLEETVLLWFSTSLSFSILPASFLFLGWDRWVSSIISSWALDRLLLSAFWPLWSFAYCKKRHLWGGVRAALIYGHKDMDLGDSLILCSFTKIVTVGSPIGACEVGLTSNQKAESYFRGICITTVPMSVSCHVIEMFISAYANWASTASPGNSLGSKYSELRDSSSVSKEASLEDWQVGRFCLTFST